MIRYIIDLSLRNRMVVLFLTALVIVMGVYAVENTPVDAIPDLSDVQVIIYSKWEGRDPQTIEDQVTYPLTTKMLAVPGAQVVRGYSFFGFSLVYIIFKDGTDLYWARSRVLEYLSGMQLPQGVQTSLGPDATGVGWIYEYTVEDKNGQYDLGELRAIQDWYIRYQLETVSDVAEVASVGGYEREYQVIIDPNKLFSLNIPLGKVAEAIHRGNNDVGGGVLEMSEREYMLRGRGYIHNTRDLEDLVVGVDKNGIPILIRDIAKAVVIGPGDRRGITDKNGQGQVVGGVVIMRYGKNALDVINRVKKKLEEIKKGLPPGVVIKTAYDRSRLIKRAVSTLTDQLTEILLMMAAVSLVFLVHFQSAVVSWIALPIGTLIAFIIMYLLGINSNIMSLGGIALALGEMSDGAISLIENLHKKMEHERGNRPHWEVVAEAAKEIGPGIFGSLFVLMVSFLPIFALTGQSGRLFKPLAYTKTLAMAGGCLITITLIPVLMGYFVRGKILPEKKNPINRFLIALYMPLLTFCLHYRKTALFLALLLLVSMVIPYRKIGSEFMPPLDEGDILYMPTTLPSISITAAAQALQNQDKVLKSFPEVATVFGKMGRADTSTDPAPLEMVETIVRLKPKDEWPRRKIEEGFLQTLAQSALQSPPVLSSLHNRNQRSGIRVPTSPKHPISNIQYPSSPTSQPLDSSTPRLLLSQAAKESEDMALLKLNTWIRLEINKGRTMNQILLELPGQIQSQLARDMGEVLVTRGVVSKVTPALLEVLQSAIASHLAEEEISLRAVRGTNELMYEEMDPVMKFPGFTNAWTMPIKTRIDMLSTGIKTPVGIKIFGPDLATLQNIALRVEKAVQRDPGTLSAIAQRVMEGNYIDFDINREACARYGLTVGDVQDVIETAIGGMALSQTVEGPYRFNIALRYPSELRDNPDELKHILVSTPTGVHIPLSTVANIKMRRAAPAILSENSMREAIVYVDLTKEQDVGSYVERVKKMIDQDIKLPTGYYISWSGQYEYMMATRERMKVILPLTLMIVLLVIYFVVGSLSMTFILLITLPFSLVGGFWYLYLMGFNMSIAVVSGFIVLAGFASQTALVMHVYLDLSMEKRIQSGVPITKKGIEEAMLEGAVLRVRPKIMSVATVFFGLLPLLWTSASEAGPLLRMAVPLMGGIFTSVIHTLLLIPLYYAIYLERKFKV